MTEDIRRARLFVGSYALLFVLLAIRFNTTWLEIVCGVLAGYGFLDMAWIVFHVSKRTAEDPIKIATVHDAGADVAGYLATYLLPFLTVAEPNDRDVIAYAIFILVTGLIYIRSDMAQINPTMYLMGARVAHVVTDHGWDGYVVARSSLHPEDVIQVVSLNPAVRVQIRSDEDRPT